MVVVQTFFEWSLWMGLLDSLSSCCCCFQLLENNVFLGLLHPYVKPAIGIHTHSQSCCCCCVDPIWSTWIPARSSSSSCFFSLFSLSLWQRKKDELALASFGWQVLSLVLFRQSFFFFFFASSTRTTPSQQKSEVLQYSCLQENIQSYSRHAFVANTTRSKQQIKCI